MARERRSARATSGRHGSHLLAYVVLGATGALMAFPFVWQIIMSLSTNAEVQSVTPVLVPERLVWENYAEVFRRLPFLEQLSTSVLITVIRSLAQLLLCTMAGFAFARLVFPGRDIIFALLLVILMVPGQVYLLTQFQIVMKLGLLNSVAGLVLPGLFSAFGTFLMRTAFAGLPRELEDAAKLDGANTLQLFARIMVPLVKPTMSVLVVTTALWSWNDLLWPLVVSTRASAMPLSAGIASLTSDTALTDYPVVLAASLLAMAPILIIFMILQRRVIEGLTFGGLK